MPATGKIEAIAEVAKILKLFAIHGRVSREEIMHQTGMSRATFFRYLQHLKLYGVKIVNINKNGEGAVYRVRNWGIFFFQIKNQGV